MRRMIALIGVPLLLAGIFVILVVSLPKNSDDGAELAEIRHELALVRCGMRVYEDLSAGDELDDESRFGCYERLTGNEYVGQGFGQTD